MRLQIVVLTCLGILLSACGSEEAGPGLEWAEAIRIDLRMEAEAPGVIEPLRRVDVVSRASGEIVEIRVDVGDRVEPGALLARIDPREVERDHVQAQVDLEVARERYRIAQSQLERSGSLLAAGVITDQDHESRRLDHANAHSALLRAETTLEHARLRREDAIVRAPLGGVVLSRPVEPGQVITSPGGSVAGGTVLLTIAELDTVQVRSLVSERDVGPLRPGMEVTVQVEAHPGRSFPGVVEKIEPQAEVQQGVVSYPVLVRLENPAGLLRPGMSATVNVVLSVRANALAIPNHAIVGPQDVPAVAAGLGIPDGEARPDPSALQELVREGMGARAGVAGAAGGGGARVGGLAPGTVSIGGPAGVTAIGSFGPGGGDGAAPRTVIQTGEARSAVVFVEEADGRIRPRPILVGATDWHRTEVLAGLDEGERVLIPEVIPSQGPGGPGGPGGGGTVIVRF